MTTYWKVSTARSTGRRDQISLQIDRDAEAALISAEGPYHSIAEIDATCSAARLREDCPWVFTCAIALSERAMESLHDVVKNDCDFIKLKLYHRGRPFDQTYFVLHIRHCVDCINPEKSIKIRGSSNYSCEVIDTRQIPVSLNLFRIKFSLWTCFASEQVRIVCEKKKITGVYFLPIKKLSEI